MAAIPFQEGDELCKLLEIHDNGVQYRKANTKSQEAQKEVQQEAQPEPRQEAQQETRQEEQQEVQQEAPVGEDTLPGDSRIALKAPDLEERLKQEFMTPTLNKLSPYLWLMATQSSAQISSLTKQLVIGREIVITEDPNLHLIWISNRVFIKPLPDYLLSHAFWDYYLVSDNSPIAEPGRTELLRAASGFLRSYSYLVRHKSDFILATQEKTRLIPEKISYPAFAKFIEVCGNIPDMRVSPRYHFGELRLTRLNLWVKILLFKHTYHPVELQYAAYFARYYAPALFVFAVFSLLLSAMQLTLAVRTVLEPNDAWLAFARAARGLALFTIFMVLCVILFFVISLVTMVLYETSYALRVRYRKGSHNHINGDGENLVGN